MRTFMAVAPPAAAAPGAAQHEHHGGGSLPPGRHGRVDRSDQNRADVRFMTMGAGFHVGFRVGHNMNVRIAGFGVRPAQ